MPAHVEALVAMYHDNLGVTVAVEQTENVLDGRSSFWTAGWSADYPDPENFVDILFPFWILSTEHILGMNQKKTRHNCTGLRGLSLKLVSKQHVYTDNYLIPVAALITKNP